MNQLPIELTLYYPTAAQFENYLGFMAIMSIAVSLLYLSLPAWLWSASKTIMARQSSYVLFLSLNPIGTISLLAIHIAAKLEQADPWPIFLIWLLSPFAALYVFSAIH